MEAKKARRAVAERLRIASQTRSRQNPALLFSYEYEEKQRTCAGLPVDSHSARDCRPISNWGQNSLEGVEEYYSLTPGEEWVEGGVEGLQLVSLQGNPPEGGLRQGTRFNPEIGCFHKVLQPIFRYNTDKLP